MVSPTLSVIKIAFITDGLNSKVYLTGQAISKLQIPIVRPSVRPRAHGRGGGSRPVTKPVQVILLWQGFP